MSSSPQKIRHGYHHLKLARLADDYVDETPGIEGCVNATSILGPDAEPQPDACLYILPEYGGQTAVDEKGYMTGPRMDRRNKRQHGIDRFEPQETRLRKGWRARVYGRGRTHQTSFLVHPPPRQIQTASRRRRWHHPLRGFPRLLARRRRISESRKQAPCRSDASGAGLGGACGIRGEARQQTKGAIEAIPKWSRRAASRRPPSWIYQ